MIALLMEKLIKFRYNKDRGEEKVGIKIMNMVVNVFWIVCYDTRVNDSSALFSKDEVDEIFLSLNSHSKMEIGSVSILII